ncbi:TPR domain protein [Paecilomyces variotii No. 5]|uniref:TPR domain protein n=1 Tax=Byssochlamys spectabilis (strain No. 5 / NBRC 109023) TaxID=1356009 RepID=V5FTS1_BYSSN|nr:TPR domain protein [Paecilomyces variotii No. 5]
MADISFGDRNTGLQMGISNGSVTAHFHVPAPERPETPPNPSSTVPFPRDLNFVSRDTLLNILHEKASTPASRVGLVGLGGVGKSQAVIEYCYGIREQYPQTWVFWVHASNQARFEQSYWDIADRAKISGRKDPNVGIFKLVHDWLHEEKSGRWILILDNMDDARFLDEPPPTSQSQWENGAKKPLLSYLPVNPEGSMIVTSCNKAAASRIVEDINIVAVEPMDNIQALTLFRRTLRMQENQQDKSELVAALEYMPLAIVQAASYIKQRAPRYSVKQYLAEFERSDRKKIALLDHRGGELRRDREAKNSIILTWQVSFDYIREIRPTAADLLSLMSFFDRQGIPDYLLREYNDSWCAFQQSRISKTVLSDDDNLRDDEIRRMRSDADSQFEKDILTLKDYSFVSNTNAMSFEMHRLVQLSTQKWLEAHAQLERWKVQFIRNLSMEFPTGEYETWGKCQLLFPHVQSALTQRPDANRALYDWDTLLLKAFSFASGKGHLADAEAIIMKIMKEMKRGYVVLEGTLTGLFFAVVILTVQRKYKESEDICRQILAPKELRRDDPDVLYTMEILGLVLDQQEKYDEAEEIRRQILQTAEGRPQVDYVDIPTRISLAMNLDSQGRYDEAEDLLRWVLAYKERELGVDHPFAVKSMRYLGIVLRHKGKYEEAASIAKRAITAGTKLFGPDHPTVEMTTVYLRMVLHSQLECNQSKMMDEQGLSLHLKEMEELADILKLHDRYVDALRVIQRYFGLPVQKHPPTKFSAAKLDKWQSCS